MAVKIYTIGFTKKTAKEFFELLIKSGVKKVIDIRLGNKSQLAGFAKGIDLEYFLGLHHIEYEHDESLAPTEELRKKYEDKENKMTFEEYTVIFNDILEQRKSLDKYKGEDLDGVCFLCSEEKPDKCHRNLVVTGIKASDENVVIIHL